MGKYIDLTGNKYGKLTVLKYEGSNRKRKTSMWLCRCECGNKKIIASHDLKHGTISCGCVLKEQQIKNLEKGRKTRMEAILKSNPNYKSRPKPTKTVEKHGMCNTRIYGIWGLMKARCDDPKRKEYHNYGGRGITYCPDWKLFTKFYSWAKESGYANNLTLDRKDNNGNYEPENCKWATIKEQSNNKRNNRYLEFNGVKMTLSEWADKCDLTYHALSSRINRGWDITRALTTPMKRK